MLWVSFNNSFSAADEDSRMYATVEVGSNRFSFDGNKK